MPRIVKRSAKKPAKKPAKSAAKSSSIYQAAVETATRPDSPPASPKPAKRARVSTAFDAEIAAEEAEVDAMDYEDTKGVALGFETLREVILRGGDILEFLDRRRSAIADSMGEVVAFKAKVE